MTTASAANFDRPIFIVSTPRAGSTLLFETLAQAPDLYSICGESHGLIESIPALSPPLSGWRSNRLTGADASEAVAGQLATNFYRALRDRDGVPASGRVRMLEKTPKNALRTPFFDAVFRDSLFVYLYRDVRQTLASMMEAWMHGGFRTYPKLPGWSGYPWSMLLVPGWRELIGRPLPEVVARQWAITTTILLDDLEKLPRERVRALTHDRFLASPQDTIEALAGSLRLRWDRPLGERLPLSKVTVSQPGADKWRRLERIIEPLAPIFAQADERARTFAKSLSV